jgi:hypothetical protein
VGQRPLDLVEQALGGASTRPNHELTEAVQVDHGNGPELVT